MGRSSTKIGLLCLWVLLESQVALCAGPQPPVDKHKDYFASQCAEEKHESPAGHGLKYWVYIPNRLRHGTSAPVVVFLHGFGSQDPRYYLLHIRHLCLQGNVVIFPQFLATSLGGKIEDQLLNADQHKFLARAIHAVEEALSDLGTQTNGEDITIYGHSLGGGVSAGFK